MDLIEEKYQLWLGKVNDTQLKEELLVMKNNQKTKTDAFFKDLEFGTGGLRGEIGAGTNCLNIYTIRKVTAGIAHNMLEKGQKTAAVSCDSRINSELFKKVTAEVFASFGIKTYITKELMPTPFLSFMTRYEKADIGVMITASHNPKRYNGYKVYGADGCQLTDLRASEMTEYIEKVDCFSIKTDTAEKYMANGLIEFIDDEVIDAFLSAVKKQQIGDADGLKITYSALNGTGYKLVPEILREIGCKDISLVKEQSYPDGSFETCPYPNPEKEEALRLGLKYARENDSDILIATDPDCDRIGIAVKHNGEYVLMTGNEVGVLLTDYILTKKKKEGTLPQNPVIVKTIVTTYLADKIAEEKGATVYNVLTGFKYIGDIIGKLEKLGEENRFILGFEESYGYLSGTYVRDKDAVNGAMMIAGMAAHYKREGKTLIDVINSIYKKYGTYVHKLMSFEFDGAEGNIKMRSLLENLRKNPIAELAGSKIVKSVDYLTQTETDLPKSNVLAYFAENGSSLVIRPSGTEPLIKTYLTASKTPEENEVILNGLRLQLNKLFKA